MVAGGRWVSPRSAIRWRNRPRGWCWSRSSSPTSSMPATGSGPSVRRRRRWSSSVRASSSEATGLWRPISGTSSGPSITGCCSRRCPGGSRTGGCSSGSACGCRQECWPTVSSPGRSRERRRAGSSPVVGQHLPGRLRQADVGGRRRGAGALRRRLRRHLPLARAGRGCPESGQGHPGRVGAAVASGQDEGG
jgi:hypothetical protein